MYSTDTDNDTAVATACGPLRAAVRACLACGVPFALVRRPGHGMVFGAQAPAGTYAAREDCDVLTVNMFAGSERDNIDIPMQLDAAAAAAVYGAQADCAVEPDDGSTPHSTPRAEYMAGLGSLIDKLRVRGGKVVISRTVCGHGHVDAVEAALRYFEALPDTFGFLYHTPTTGMWLGASPEVLLKMRGREFSTMALAGTRPAGLPEPWDAKNVDEQAMVAGFIAGVLTRSGAAFEAGATAERDFGRICHLCTPFTGTLPEGLSADALMAELSPTPALAGLPRRLALEDICATESHDRMCYGGYVALRGRGYTDAYVNLRSARITASGYCIYTGSGITAQSDPAAEWDETEAKCAMLLNILKNTTVNEQN